MTYKEHARETSYGLVVMTLAVTLPCGTEVLGRGMAPVIRAGRRHRNGCGHWTCNPRGNPQPLAVDGRAYSCRRKARQRRRNG